MLQAWYIDTQNGECLEQKKMAPKYISAEELYNKTGVEYFKLNVETYKTDGILDSIKKERGYSYEDEMVCSEKCLSIDEFEEKKRSFATEHLHSDEEIRFLLEGAGYFDVRDSVDHWIRIKICAGDLIILPGGIYHRFEFDSNKHIKMKRLFSEEPAWQAYNRPADAMPCRQRYMERIARGFAAAN
ncbi:acireductone dioxygenase [Amyelois transitella]|uniref:acireductone dioxygenase n=1 Tax=Amyelois transitella TaxID=680683 RepID=UPI0029900FBF|nr:acireductone dioxygenase [Amyelois transitella]XP_013183918.2 acireductone dioxygenase [Amyelois transitella]